MSSFCEVVNVKYGSVNLAIDSLETCCAKKRSIKRRDLRATQRKRRILRLVMAIGTIDSKLIGFFSSQIRGGHRRDLAGRH